MTQVLSAIAFTFILSAVHLKGALMVDVKLGMSPSSGITTKLRFTQTAPTLRKGSSVELSYLGQLALLNSVPSSPDLVLTNADKSTMAFNIRAALYDFDSYVVLEQKAKILVISHFGDLAYAKYVAKYGGIVKPSTLVDSVNGNIVRLIHFDADNRNNPYIRFSVRIKRGGIIELNGVP